MWNFPSFQALVLTILMGSIRASNDGEEDPVTCGSLIKLENLFSGVRLHSHDIKYGSGSGQQSVTGMSETGDVNSHWQILGPINQECIRGTPVKCGSIIRLMHLATKCFLHSHLMPAPLSRSQQEISCFGKQEKDSESSDSGDHFKVLCNGDFWTQSDEIRLKHEDTGKFLAISGQKYSRPIAGQLEIAGISTANSREGLWSSAEGIYIKPMVK